MRDRVFTIVLALSFLLGPAFGMVWASSCAQDPIENPREAGQ